MTVTHTQKMVLALTTAFLLLPLGSSIASAKTCKSYYVTASGDKKFSNLSARLSARSAWRKKVRKRISFRWSTYANARNKSYSCRRVGVKWRCTAKAKPCKL